MYAEGPTDSSYSLAHTFSPAAGSDSFSYSATEGDGSYSFYSVATDKAGNIEAKSTADTSTLLDTQAPNSSASSPTYSTSTSFSVSYTAADPIKSGDVGPASGLDTVKVYAEGPTDSSYSLAHTFSPAAGSDSFSYSATEGDGSYSFYSVATDKAGNIEAKSTADTSTLLDTQAPNSSASSPTYSTSTSFSVSYTAADPIKSGDVGPASGLDTVKVYAEGPTDSSYSLAHTFSPAAGSDSFSYSATEGDGSYSFYSVATDKAGNIEAKSTADTSTLLDTQAPNSSASSPTYSTSTSFSVSYTAADPIKSGDVGPASGLDTVKVYAEGPTDSSYSLAHTFSPAAGSDSFSYSATEGDGSYSFYSVATDKAGNIEAKSTADTSTLLDTTPPKITFAVTKHGSAVAATEAGTGWYNIASSGTGGIDLTVTASDGSNVASLLCKDGTTTIFSLSGGSSGTLSNSSAVVLGDGQHSISCTAKDGLGNNGASSSSDGYQPGSPSTANATYKVDQTTPTAAITFPVNGTTYKPTAYYGGCGTPSSGTPAQTDGDVCGTSSDATSGVDTVKVEIQRASDSKYWNGSGWVSTATWNDATGTTTWSFAFTDPTGDPSETYTLTAQATDKAGNTKTASVSFTVAKIATTILYNGNESVAIGNTLNLSALLSPSSCAASQTVTFALDQNPTGTYTSLTLPDGTGTGYIIGTGTTNSGGTATASVSTLGWTDGPYTVYAIFAGSTDCKSSYDNASLTVANPGDSAQGGGWEAGNSTNGRMNFGFTINLVPGTGGTTGVPAAYKGQFLMINNGAWRLKGTLNTFVQQTTTSGISGSADGVGTLYSWNNTTLTWNLAATNVTFSIAFADNNNGGGKKTTTPDTFGIQIKYTTSNPIPNNKSNPTALKGGDISIKTGK